MTKRAIVASGVGRYADPWHPFSETSLCIADVLSGAGFEVAGTESVDDAMVALDGVDLLVVNAGDSWRSDDATAPPTTAIEGFASALSRGIGVLAFHAATTSLRDYPEWAPAIGKMWVPGLSWHPPADLVSVSAGTLPDGSTTPAFETFDERYCRLQEIGRSHLVCTHRGVDRSEPTAWVREVGASRIAVDALGHDTRSFDSEGHRQMIERLAWWAAAATDRSADR